MRTDGKLWLWDVRKRKASKVAVDSMHIGQMKRRVRQGERRVGMFC